MAGHWTGNPYKWEGGGANTPHIARYFIAKGWIMPGETVLDAACCTGYGSKLLATVAKQVIGYDVDEGCIEDANRDRPDNCEFQVMDLNTCELPEVDVTISIETIEHLDDMHHFIKEAKKKTRRMILACCPIGGTSFAYVNEAPGPATEKNDFYRNEDFEKVLVDDEWKILTSFNYGYSLMVILYKKSPEETK